MRNALTCISIFWSCGNDTRTKESVIYKFPMYIIALLCLNIKKSIFHWGPSHFHMFESLVRAWKGERGLIKQSFHRLQSLTFLAISYAKNPNVPKIQTRSLTGDLPLTNSSALRLGFSSIEWAKYTRFRWHLSSFTAWIKIVECTLSHICISTKAVNVHPIY